MNVCKTVLEGLQADHRRCIRLAFFRGFTHTRIGNQIGCAAAR